MTERCKDPTQLQGCFHPWIKLSLVSSSMVLWTNLLSPESVHHFYKFVSGNVLVKPPWFLDVNQLPGGGLVDVVTRLVDLVQWECFPDRVIDTNLIHIDLVRRWPTTHVGRSINTITQSSTYPEYLKRMFIFFFFFFFCG
ncbi:MAG: hypothetical protein IPF93_14715 [Saprospiraceae bacterium]|nr:hypothetical protein [Saprospiraceae bacterium]